MSNIYREEGLKACGLKRWERGDVLFVKKQNVLTIYIKKQKLSNVYTVVLSEMCYL